MGVGTVSAHRFVTERHKLGFVPPRTDCWKSTWGAIHLREREKTCEQPYHFATTFRVVVLLALGFMEQSYPVASVLQEKG